MALVIIIAALGFVAQQYSSMEWLVDHETRVREFVRMQPVKAWLIGFLFYRGSLVDRRHLELCIDDGCWTLEIRARSQLSDLRGKNLTMAGSGRSRLYFARLFGLAFSPFDACRNNHES